MTSFVIGRQVGVAALAALYLAACGITGDTSHMIVPLDRVPASGELRPVKVASLERDKDRMLIASVGEVFRWGRFDDRDEANLKRSLENTLGAATSRAKPLSGTAIGVHVILRTHLIAFSNKEVAVLAGVEWRAFDEDGRLVFEESFYAAYACGRFPNICTLGMNKDAVNAAITGRITQGALALAAGRDPGDAKAQRTYLSFEEAVTALPETLVPHSEGYKPKPFRIPWERARIGHGRENGCCYLPLLQYRYAISRGQE
jgi:hypothetical protein